MEPKYQITQDCEQHPKMRNENFCLTCMRQICYECLSEHEGHQLIFKKTIETITNSTCYPAFLEKSKQILNDFQIKFQEIANKIKTEVSQIEQIQNSEKKNEILAKFSDLQIQAIIDPYSKNIFSASSQEKEQLSFKLDNIIAESIKKITVFGEQCRSRIIELAGNPKNYFDDQTKSPDLIIKEGSLCLMSNYTNNFHLAMCKFPFKKSKKVAFLIKKKQADSIGFGCAIKSVIFPKNYSINGPTQGVQIVWSSTSIYLNSGSPGGGIRMSEGDKILLSFDSSSSNLRLEKLNSDKKTYILQILQEHLNSEELYPIVCFANNGEVGIIDLQ